MSEAPLLTYIPGRTEIGEAGSRLRRRWAHSLLMILCLGTGLSAIGVMLVVMDAVFLQMPPGVSPVDSVQRFTLSSQVLNGARTPGTLLTLPVFEAIRSASSSSQLRWRAVGVSRAVVHDRQSIRSVTVGFISPAFFADLGARPAAGRLLFDQDTLLLDGIPVVVSAELHLVLAGRDSQMLGRSLRINESFATVVGVATSGFRGLEATAVDLWLPLSAADRVLGDPQLAVSNERAWIAAFVTSPDWIRASPTAAADASRGLAHVVANTNATSFGELRWQDALKPSVLRREDQNAPNKASDQPYFWLGLLALAVFLVALGNTIGLAAVETQRRAPEFATRMALGTPVVRLFRVAAAEGLLISICAVALAIWIATLALSIQRLYPELWVTAPQVSWRVVALIGSVLLVTTAAYCRPIVELSRTQSVMHLLRSQGQPGGGRATRRISRVGLFLATAILLSAGLFAERARSLAARVPPYDVSRTLIVESGFARLTMRGQLDPVLQSASERIAKLPGVEQVAVAQSSPLLSTLRAKIHRSEDPSAEFEVLADVVDSGYFNLGGPQLLRGRPLSGDDYLHGGSAVVNEELARQLFGDQEPLGRCVTVTLMASACVRVVGLVADAQYIRLDDPPLPLVLVPRRRRADGTRDARTILVRTSGSAESLVPQVQQILLELHPGARDVNVETFGRLIERELAPSKLQSRVVFAFSIVTLVVCIGGVYVHTDAVARARLRELAIRRALGASTAQLMTLVLRESVLSLAVALPTGLCIALLVGRFVAMPERVPAADVLALSAPALLALSIAVIFASLPSAILASRVDPNALLRLD